MAVCWLLAAISIDQLAMHGNGRAHNLAVDVLTIVALAVLFVVPCRAAQAVGVLTSSGLAVCCQGICNMTLRYPG
jgi:hypothetical protein